MLNKPDWEDQEQGMYTPRPVISNCYIYPDRGPLQGLPEDFKKYEMHESLKEKLNKAMESVKSPSHYKKSSNGVESIEATMASMSQEAFRGHLKGNVQKYVWRYEDKAAPLQDLKKAERYLKWLIEHLETGKITV